MVNLSLTRFLALNLAKFYQSELANYNRFIQEHPECIFLKPNQQEDVILSLFSQTHIKIQVHQCYICNSEILNFYAHCPACTSLKNKNTPVITCLDCYEVIKPTLIFILIKLGTYKRLRKYNKKVNHTFQTF